MRNFAGLVIVLGVLGALGLTASRVAVQSQARPYFPTRDAWERRSPAEVGMDAAKLAAALDFAREMGVTGPRNFAVQRARPDQIGPLPDDRADTNGIILRHGYIVAEFGDTTHVDPTYSVAKSYLSTLLGLAIDRGLIKSVSDPVRQYVSDGGYDSPHNAPITWEHHARQTSEWDGTIWGKDATSSCTTQDGQTLHRRLYEPGTLFEYNDARINRFALSLLRVWKRPLPDVLKTEVMDPIGASDTWRWVGYDNSSVDVGGTMMTSVSGGSRWGGGIWMSTRDHARFGYLMLRRGEWNGRRILSEPWITQATSPPSGTGRQDYGYLWWLNASDLWPGAPRYSYAAVGDGSNTIWVDPAHDLVIVWRWSRGNEAEFFKRVVASIDSTVQADRAPAAPEDPNVLRVGGTVRLPRKTLHVAPVVPAGVEPHGTTILKIRVSPEGKVDRVQVLRTVQPPEVALDLAAVEAVRKWEWAPTIVDGVARPVELNLTVEFGKLSSCT